MLATNKLSGSARRAGISLAALALAASPILAQAKVVSAVPEVVGKATSHGQIAPATDMHLTVWLAVNNRDALDKKVADLYTPGSPSFHKWLSTEELLSFAPSASEVKAVKDELKKQGLSVIEDGRDNYSIAVHGSAATVQAAFGTRVDELEKGGRIFHANTTEATFKGDASKYVEAVTGFSTGKMTPMFQFAKDPSTGKALPMIPLTKSPDASILSTYFTDKCFSTPSEYTFGTAGSLPVGVYFGNVYDKSTKQCGYTATQMQEAYDLPDVYKAGFKGQGQTIVIVDAYGSATLQADANVFNTLNGLPPLTSSNFKTLYPEGPVDPSMGIAGNWYLETTLDVEWAHAIAPAAKIVLVAASSDQDEDLIYAVEYAAVNKLGSVVSNSYGGPESESDPAGIKLFDLVNQLAAASGISVNYSSGDGGDDTFYNLPVGANAPADSPYGTAVGGTSLGVPGGSGKALETGWGNNQTELACFNLSGTACSPAGVTVPPYNFGFGGGAGGGESSYFAKPSWQKSLRGKGRQVPDVAMEADPYTGAILVLTSPTAGLQLGVIGGTSLASPMFSAYWALANQKAGHLLGQAAPIISTLSANALSDIVPAVSPTNVVGTVINATGATFYSAATLAAPLDGTKGFSSAIWPYSTPSYSDYNVITFGTDSSLHTTKGWDNVTGYGTPKGLGFITEAAR